MLRSGFAVLVILALLTPSTVRAEEEPQDEAKHPLRPGVWALEFEIQPRLSYSSGTPAAALYMRKHLTERSALRAGVLVGSTERDVDGEGIRQDPYVPGLSTYEIDSFDDRQEYSASLQFVRFVLLRERIGVFVAAGPTFRLVDGFYRDNVYYPNGDYSIYEVESDSRGFGLDAAAGFEWFFLRRLSLGARQGIAATYSEGDFRRDFSDFRSGTPYISIESGESKIFQFSTTATLLTLTAYF